MAKEIRWWNRPLRIPIWFACLMTITYLFNSLKYITFYEHPFEISLSVIGIWLLTYWINKSADKWYAKHNKKSAT